MPKISAQPKIQKLVKIGDAANILGVSIDTLRRWEKKGKIQAIRTPGGTRLYNVKRLKNFLQEPQVPHISPVSPREAEIIERKEEAQNTNGISEILDRVESAPLKETFQTTTTFYADPIDQKESSILEKINDSFSNTSDNVSQYIQSVGHYLPNYRLFLSAFGFSFTVSALVTVLWLWTPQSVVQPLNSKDIQTTSKGAELQQLGRVAIEGLRNARAAFDAVLAASSSAGFLEINSDLHLNGSLNGLSIKSDDNSSLSVTNGDIALDQTLTASSSPTFSSLNLSSATNQITSGALNFSLPATSTTLVGIDTTQTITNKSISGSANTLTNIPNSALTNHKVTISPGTNLTGGGDVELGSSVTISMKSSPVISGVLSLPDGTAAAPSLTFTDDTDTGLYRIGANKIGLITAGTATSGITIDANGNVGIGTITPTTTLHVVGTGNITSNTTIGGTLGVTAATTLSSTLAVTGDTTLTGDLAVNGADLTTTATTFNLINATATTLNIGGAATALSLGASTGITTINNATTSLTGVLNVNGTGTSYFNGNVGIGTSSPGAKLAVAGGAIIGYTGTQNLSSGTDLAVSGNVGIGTSSPNYKLEVVGTSNVTGNTTIGGTLGVTGDTTLTADLAVNGGDLTSTSTTFNLLNSTVTTMNLGGAATSLTVGATTGTGVYRNAISSFLGNVGIGTSSPGAKLAVAGGTILGYTGTQNLSSGTDLGVLGNVGIGTTSPNYKLQVVGTANVTGAATFDSTGSFASTLTASNGLTQTTGALNLTSTSGAVGLTLSSSSTAFNIQSGLFDIDTASSRVGISTVTPQNKLDVNGAVAIGSYAGNNTAPTNGLLVSGNVGIGTSSPQTALHVAGRTSVGGHILPTGASIDVGSSAIRFSTGYFDTIDATTLSGTLNASAGSTQASSWTINSDNATNDTEDMSLAFERGTATPNAVLAWDTTNKEFTLNGGLHLTDTITPTGYQTLLNLSYAGTGAAFRINDDGTSADSTPFLIDANGNVGIGTSAPGSSLQVNGGGVIGFGGAPFAAPSQGLVVSGNTGIGTSTPGTAKLAILGGNVGIGTTSPAEMLHITGNIRISDVSTPLLSLRSNQTGAKIWDLYSCIGAVAGFNDCTTGQLAFYNRTDNTAPFTIRNATVDAVLNINAGNVGIGTTSPNQALEVVGGGRFSSALQLADGTNSAPALAFTSDTNTGLYRIDADRMSFVTGGASALTINSSGNVGVGTTAPIAKLHVEGQCVTGDTKLKRRRRRKGKNGEWIEDWEDIEIKDIQPGDEILSLDEHTGNFVVRKVNKLIDMGEQEVFELLTESGKSIKTTANHPYFVDVSSNEIDLSMIQKDTFEYSEKLAKQFYINHLAGRKITSKALGDTVIFTHTGWNHFVEKSRSLNELIIRFFALPRVPVVIKKADKVGYRKLKKQDITLEYWELQAVVEHVLISVIVCAIDKGPKFFLSCNWLGTKTEKGIKANKKELSLAPNAAFAGSDRRRELVIPQLFSKLTLPENRKHVKWVKVKDLRVGQKIATTSGWEKIVSIKSQGKKETFDIEIEGTHNFVGNGIVAHNTYISGNLGVGTSSPGSKLSIAGGSTIGYTGTEVAPTNGLAVLGNVGIGITSPNYKLEVVGTTNITGNTTIGGSLTVTGAQTFSGQLQLADGTNAAPSLAFTNDTNTGLYRIGTDNLGFVTGGLDRMSINSSGNVGIGTTSPAYNLQVVGTTNITGAATFGGQLQLADGTNGAPSLAFTNDTNTGLYRIDADRMSFVTGGASALTINSSGNVGVGTTNPIAKLHVEGQCVAVGTRIRRRRRKGSGDPREEDVPVEDIEPGDEVLSLNEETGEFEWHTVEKTMDMGIQEVFELTTSSGKQIQTTANHPYLTPDGWKKVSELHAGVAIATLEENPLKIAFLDETGIATGDKNQPELGVGAVTLQGNSSQRDIFNQELRKIFVSALDILEKREEIFEFKFSYVTESSLPLYKRLITVLEENKHLWDFSWTFAKHQEDTWTQYLQLTRSLFDQFYGHYIVLADHLDKPTKNNDTFSSIEEGHIQKAVQIDSQGAILLQVADILLGSIAFIRAGRKDKIKKKLARIALRLLKTTKKATVNSVYVASSQTLAQKNNFVKGESRFEEIVSIKKVGTKQTYDLQIAHTHNFVGNGIVAHNTYISGNLGVGTSSPGAKLSVAGGGLFGYTGTQNLSLGSSLAVSGNVGIGTTSPNYNLEVVGTTNITGNTTIGGSLTVTGTQTFSGQLQLADGSNSAPSLAFTNDTNTGLYRIGTDALGFVTGGLDRMSINSNGNVGIGTTGPGANLDISASYTTATTGNKFAQRITMNNTGATSSGTDNTYGLNISSTRSGGVGGTINNYGAYINTSSSFVSNAYGLYLDSINGATNNYGLYINSVPAAPANFALYSGAAAQSYFAGNVGIGTSAPANKLYVSTTANTDGISIDGTTNPTLNLRNSGTIKSYIGLATAGGSFATGTSVNDLILRTEDGTNGNIHFITQAGNLIAQTITRAGNVGIGTAVPNGLLDVANNFVVKSGGNVGIGTTSPLQALHVIGTEYISGNLGIGTSSPGTKLSVAGGGLFGYTGTQSLASGTDLAVLGNVGIGTTSPNYKLEVVGNTNIAGNLTVTGSQTFSGALSLSDGTAASPALAFTNDTNTGLYRIGTDNLGFVTGGLDRMSINSSGNVGIGTTGPGQKLEIAQGAIKLSAATLDTQNYYIGVDSTGNNLRWDSSHGTILNSSADTVINIDADNTDANTRSFIVNRDTANHGSGTELFRIQENGNVGIGTTGPTSLLHLQNSTNAQLTIDANSTSGTRLRFLNGGSNFNWQLASQQNTSNAFEITPSTAAGGTTFSTPALTIQSGGNVGIGTQSPNTKLDVIGNGTYAADFMSGNVGIGLSNPGDKLVIQDGALAFSHPSNNLSYMGIDFDATKDQLRFRSNNGSTSLNQTNMVIDRISGNVGIGTTNPTARLVIQGATADNTANNLIAQDSTGGLLLTLRNDGLFRVAPNSGAPVAVTSTGNMGVGTASPINHFQVQGGGTGTGVNLLTTSSAGAFGLAVLDNGNVGIGTTGPTAGLHIATNGAASAPGVRLDGTWFTGGSATTTKPQLLIEPTGTTSTGWSTSGTGIGINSPSGFTGNALDVQLNGARKARIDYAGGLFLSGSYGLTIGADTSPTGGYFEATASSGSMINYMTVTGTNYSVLYFRNGSNITQIGQNDNGTIGAGLNQAAIFGSQTNTATQFTTNNAVRMTLDTSGNVGVGYNIIPGAKFAVNGNVGIGTSIANTKLDVIGNGTYAADFMAGNVGIGLSNPAAQLDILTSTSTVGINLAGTALGATSGNGTGASNILTVAGTAGQATTSTAGNTAGTGSALSLTGGAGGANSGTHASNVAGAGGNITITAGTGGTTGTTGTGGAGGTLTLAGGANGVNASGGTPGAGGPVVINGGDVSSNGLSAAGGAITLTSGRGGGAGNGGALTLAAGAAGGSGTGGAISITSGVSNTAGNGGPSGAVTIGSGTSAFGSGANSGDVILQSGLPAGGTSGTIGASGAVTVRSQAGGDSTTGNAGASGILTLGTGNGGAVGTSTGTGGAAGALNITGGTGGGSNAVTGGAGSTITLTAGNGGAGSTSGGAAGAITLIGGNAGSGGNINGGAITLRTGTATGTGLAGSIIFQTNGTNERARFDPNGNLGIGYASIPGALLAVNGNVGIGTSIANTKLDVIGNGTYAADFMSGNVGVGTSTPTAPLEVKTSGTGAIAKFTTTDNTGCTLSTAGVISCTSDQTQKKNINDLSYGLDDVMRLRPVEFNWKTENDSTTKSLGFLAQDVETIIPKLVRTDEITGIKELNTIGLVPVLVQAIQQQQLQISSNSAQLASQSATLALQGLALQNIATNLTTQQISLGDITIASASGKLNIAFGGQNVMQVDSVGNLTLAGTITSQASGFDVAESYPTEDQSIEAGDVVAIATTGGSIEKTTTPYQKNAIGIITTKPGLTLTSKAVEGKDVALAGRVPVKVTTENGEIKAGDSLTTSSIPGYAMKATQPGTVIGKAFEDFSCESHLPGGVAPAAHLEGETFCQGKIMTFINISWYDPTIVFTANGILPISQPKADTIANAIASQSAQASSSAILNSQLSTLNLNEDPSFKDLLAKYDSLASRLDTLQSVVIGTASNAASPSATATPSAYLDLTASSSAEFLATIDVPLFASDSAKIIDNLTVSSRTTLNDLGVTGTITAGMLAIDGFESSINTLSGPLKLQSLALGGIDILNGKVTIDTKGNITTVATVKAKEIEAEKITTQKLVISDPVATESAVLSASSSATLNSQLSTLNSSTSAAPILASTSIGSGVITPKSTKVTINTSAVTKSAKVFITATSATDKPLAVTNVKDGQSFDVVIPSPTPGQITFNWWIVDTR